METKIRLQNIAVVNAYCIVFLPPLSPHRTRHVDRTESPHLMVHPMKGLVLRTAIKETHQTVHVLHSVNSIFCVKVKLLL
jgi:hypothetical protein